MANSRIPEPVMHIKLDHASWYRLEVVLCQASGLARLLIEQDLLNYKAKDPLHQTLWLLMDLIIEANNTGQRMLREPEANE
jgi:hypothetical protein